MGFSEEEYQTLERAVQHPVVRLLDAALRRIRDRVPAWNGPAGLFVPTLHLIHVIEYSRLKRALLRQALEEHAAKDARLLRFSDSRLGAPSDAVEWQGNWYTPNFFAKVVEYLRLQTRYDCSAVRRVLEIGPGYGCQLDVLLSAHPGMKACLVEIPPQLYITQQYLAARFPGQVCRYHEAKALGVARALERHRIVCLAPWQIGEIPDGAADLFWNHSSFQEMSPAIVRHYAAHVARVTTGALYLVNSIHGDEERPLESRTHTSYGEYLEYLPEFALAWSEDVDGMRHGLFLRTS